MRNAYPIDEALQVAGQASLTTLVDSKNNLNTLEDSIDKAGEKIKDMKSMFAQNDAELERMLSDLYDIHINY